MVGVTEPSFNGPVDRASENKRKIVHAGGRLTTLYFAGHVTPEEENAIGSRGWPGRPSGCVAVDIAGHGP